MYLSRRQASQYPSDGQYIIKRKMLISGEQFQPGDMLPADSALRRLPNRIAQFCHMRHLEPVIEQYKVDQVLNGTVSEVRTISHATVITPEPQYEEQTEQASDNVLRQETPAPKAASPKAAQRKATTKKTKKAVERKAGDKSRDKLMALKKQCKELGVSSFGTITQLEARIAKARLGW